MTPAPIPQRLRALARVVLAGAALASVSSTAAAAVPDPTERGPLATTAVSQYLAGTVNLQEPSSTSGAATGGSAAVTLQVRGSMYYPTVNAGPRPLIVLVHGNHGGCQTGGLGGTAPNCTIFNRNDRGYSYLAENLASWGYMVASIDQDQMMSFQDNGAKGMHARRLLIAATLDALYEANEHAIPDDADHNLGTSLVGRLEMNKIGLMGHSRGGDAVTSFMDYNRTRPAPGRRYNISGVISLAPVDYERRSPYGSAYLTILPACDGDVSNLQGARFFERGQRISPGDPFPKIQMYMLGANHGNYNTVWSADSDDNGTTADAACGGVAANQSTSIRLSGGVLVGASVSQPTNWLETYSRATAFSADPALMGDQEKLGLATMSAFFRRYVGNETAFDPYMTGELTALPGNNNVPATACPTSVSGTRIACNEYVQTSYFAPPAERTDVIGPDTDNPLTASALGTALQGSGFANPYTDNGGIVPKPATTTGGYDWCNPEPNQFQTGVLGITGYPTAAKGCPLPAPTALGGQAATRENAPINHSYGEQLALAWNDPLDADGKPAVLQTRIPAAAGDVSTKKSLALGAAVNFFDTRNPDRSGDAQWNPALTTQDFAIELTDAAGRTATVNAADRRYGTALQQTTGSTTPKTHIVLNQLRVPLADFAEQGLDLTRVRKLALKFGGDGFPATGSIQLADVRFQEATAGPTALTGRSGSAEPASVIEATPRAAASAADPDVVLVGASAKALATCTDTKAPTAKVLVKRVARGKLTVSGVASDRGCAATKGTVKTVQLSVTKRVAGGKCRFAAPSGKLGKPLPCKSAVTLTTKGTSRWSLKLAGRLPKGRYAVAVLAIDAGGNAATQQAGTITVR